MAGNTVAGASQPSEISRTAAGERSQALLEPDTALRSERAARAVTRDEASALLRRFEGKENRCFSTCA
jgi:hypothetical protein